MTSEAVTAFSIRRFEATEERGSYYAVTTKNALGRTDTKQVPAEVFEAGGGVRAAAEAELKATLQQAQDAYNDLHERLADLSRQQREATAFFEREVRRLFGVRVNPPQPPEEENGTDDEVSIRLITPTSDEDEGEEEVPAT